MKNVRDTVAQIQNNIQTWVSRHSGFDMVFDEDRQAMKKRSQELLQKTACQTPLESAKAVLLVRHINLAELLAASKGEIRDAIQDTTRTILLTACKNECSIHQLDDDLYAVVIHDLENIATLHRKTAAIVSYGLHEWSFFTRRPKAAF